MGDIKRVKVGDPITAKGWNEVVDKLRPFTRIEVAQGSYLNYSTGPSGTCLSLAIPKEIPARLIGSSSPYSWTAITETAGGTYADRVAGLMGGTSNAYEINSKANLGGKPVMLEWTSAGDWRFQWVGVGASGFAWTVTVGGCSGFLPGALVEVKQSGVLIDSCVTGDGTGGTILGKCTLHVPAGTYTLIITGPTGKGFAVNTSSQTVAGTKATTIILGPDSDHICWNCCNYPIPKTLYTADDDGPITLTWTTGATYVGTADSEVGTTCLQGETLGSCVDCVSPGVVTKRYQLSLLSACQARLFVIVNAVCCAGVPVFSPGPGGPITPNDTATFTGSDCEPFSLAFNIPTFGSYGSCGSPALPTPGGGGLITVTK